MKELLAWSAKNVFVPLIPFGIGAFIRLLSGIEKPTEIFDAGELCFSMAMLCMLVISSASRLQDRDLRDSITSLYVFGVILFVVLFAISSFARVQIESGTLDMLSHFRDALKNGISPTPDKADDRIVAKFSTMLISVWRYTVTPATATVLLTLICKVRYGLAE